MSGAEAGIVVGLISGVISIIEAAKTVYDAAGDAKGQPEAFRQVAARMPLVIEILRSAEERAQALDETALDAIEQTLESCKAKAEKLKKIFQKVIRKDNDKWFDRYKKALSTLGKGDKVECLMEGILKDTQLLAYEKLMGIATETQAKELEEGIKEMKEMPSSFQEEMGSVTQNHHGSGNNNANTGQGAMHTGSGDLYHNEIKGDAHFGSNPAKQVINYYNLPLSSDQACVRESSLYDKATVFVPTGVPMEKAKNECLKHLQFLEMETRHHDINPAANDTCDWLLEHPNFLEWTRRKKGLLWIRGKPGAGKSTLMKYTIDASARDDTLDKPKPIVLSFFFHGRGSEIQKTPLGFYRSILYQILSKAPDMAISLILDFETKRTSRDIPGVNWDWHVRELQQHLASSLAKLSTHYSVRLFVDALDEGGESIAQSMVDEFHELLGQLNTDNKLAICFSCRHYPVLEVDDCDTIVVEDENDKDIETFVASSFRNDAKMKKVQEIIIEKAMGSFQWAYLVVELVKRNRRQGSLPQKIQQSIQKIPPDLNKLYRELLETIAEDERAEVLLLFEWLLFAQKSLSLHELRIITAIDPKLPYSTLDEYRDHGILIDNNDDFGRRLTTISRGLAEVRQHEGQLVQKIVQFNHQSVIDFMLEDGLQILLEGQWQTPELAIGRAHHTLSRSCIYFIGLDHHISNIPLGSLDEYFTISEDEDELDWGQRNYLYFALYAVKFWVHHERKAQLNGISSVDLLTYFNWPSNDLMKRWSELYHLLDAQAYYFAPRGSTILHVICENGFLDALRAALDQLVGASATDIVDCQNEHGETPVFWAASEGQVDAVKLLLEVGRATPDCQDIQGRSPLSCAAFRGRDEVVKLLLARDDVDYELKECEGRTPLSRAAERGHTEIVKLLLDHGADPNSRDYEGRTPLIIAAQVGREEVLRQLLARNDVPPDVQDDHGQTPLSWAARNKQVRIVEHLLTCHQIQPDLEDSQGRTPLSWAVGSSRNALELNRKAVIDLLLKKNVSIDSKDSNGRTPLSWAAEAASRTGDCYAIDRLLKLGVEADCKDATGRTPLSWAVGVQQTSHHVGERFPAVKLLLGRDDVEADSKDNSGRTPLSWAAAAPNKVGKNASLDMLLSVTGVKSDSRDALGRSPLSWAAASPNEYGINQNVRTLVALSEVEADSMDNIGRTPLSWAAGSLPSYPVDSTCNRNLSVDVLLSSEGVNPLSEDIHGHTPLWWALEKGNYKAVATLEQYYK